MKIMYEQEKNEIQTLKSYLLSQIPATPLPPNGLLLSSNSVALKAAIAGLDKEVARLEREERLVKKFTAANGAEAGVAGTKSGKRAEDDADMEYVKMTKEDATATANDGDVAMDDTKDEEEWEEAEAAASPAKKHQKQDEKAAAEHHETYKLCQKLASAAVSRIANANIKVENPLGALGLALHAALAELTDEVNREPVFRCTGVPDTSVTSQLLGTTIKSAKGGGGFAPPIRELPRSQLVPSKWEENATFENGVVAFRYKCGKEVYSTDSGPNSDATTVYLALQLLQGSDVAVTFGTLPSKGKSIDENQQLKFSLGRHVNLDGFQAAKTKNGSGGTVSPSLFYISLVELFVKFSSTFPVLPKKSMSKGGEESASLATPATKSDLLGTDFQQSVPMPAIKVAKVETTRPDLPPDGIAVDRPNHTDPLRVMDSQRRDKHKDFEGDLLPGGPQPGGLHDMPTRGTGSQVGPDHPMFDRTFGDDYYGYNEDDLGFGNGAGGGSFGVPGVGGGMGMRPRFDPYGPPGGPTEPGRGGRGGRFPGRGSRLGSGRGGRGGRMPPGGFGNPNPDHMTPPGGGYFS